MMTTTLEEDTTQVAGQMFVVAGEGAAVDRVEEDGVDWCAWWAEYAETWE